MPKTFVSVAIFCRLSTRYPSSLIAFRMRSRRSGLTPGFPLMTNDTVERETPTASATSRMLGAFFWRDLGWVVNVLHSCPNRIKRDSVYLILAKLQTPRMGDIHQNQSNAIITILTLCSKKGNSGCGYITHNFYHNDLQNIYNRCTYTMIDHFIELFTYIPNKSSRIIETNILNYLLTIVTCSCYNKNNYMPFSYNNKTSLIINPGWDTSMTLAVLQCGLTIATSTTAMSTFSTPPRLACK